MDDMFFRLQMPSAFRFQSLNFSPTFQDEGTSLMTLISLCRAAGDMSQNDGFFPPVSVGQQVKVQSSL